MLCPNCQKESPGKFCPYCGAKMPFEASAQPTAGRPEAPAPRGPEPAAPQGGVVRRPASIPAQAYVAAPGSTGSYRTESVPVSPSPAGALNGETPARQWARKLAASPAFLIAVLAFTATMLMTFVNVWLLMRQMPETLYNSYKYPEYQRIARIIGYVAEGLLVLVYASFAAALWSIYCGAVKRSTPLRTGGLTVIKSYLVIGLVVICILVLLITAATVLVAASGDLDGVFNELDQGLSDAMRSSQAELPFPVERGAFGTLYVIFVIVILVVIALLIVYLAKLIKTVNTVKRVILTGYPDDRVSMLVLVCCVLGAVGSIMGITRLLSGGAFLGQLPLTGLSRWLYLGSAASSIIMDICFAVLLYRWRDGMRALGAYKGSVMPRL